MSAATIPIFVVGSGRSGTRSVFKLLSGIRSIEIHHEYLCTHVQQVATLYFMRMMDESTIKQEFMKLHGSAIYYSKAKYWVDCSNKLSWIIEPIFQLLPNARFVHLVRDGRKVANSYYQKLSDEMYDDDSVEIIQRWLADPDGLPMPPPEKKYWWNVPQADQPFAKEFQGFNQFQRACYQWVESNRVIIESLKRVPKEQQLLVKLEDLTSDREILKRFLSFFDVTYEEHYFEYLQTPQNVVFPMDFKLTEIQTEQFNQIASDMMQKLGYAGAKEYSVDYGTPPTQHTPL